MRRDYGTGGLVRYRKGFWYGQYFVNGQRIRVSLKTKSKQVARVRLNRLMADRDAGKLPTVGQARVTYADLRKKLLQHYSDNNLKSLIVTKDGEQNISGLEALDAFFGASTKATDITAESRNAFVNARKNQGIGNAFINRSLELLTKMFSLAIEDRALIVAPVIKKLKEPPPRKGFVTREQFEGICNALPVHLRPLAILLFYTGVRLGEATQIRWAQVSLKSGLIQLDGDQTKNQEPRRLPMPDILIKLLKNGPVQPVKDGLAFSHQNFTKGWRQACVDAGLGKWRDPKNKDAGYDGTIVHDMRRSAIKLLTNAGASQVVTMRISGHKTASVFARYNIAGDADVVAAMKRVEAQNGVSLGRNTAKPRKLSR